MTFSKKLKNLLFFNALILISACGGGGGGGITNKISDFINDDISSLSGSADIITNSNNLIRNFNAVVSNGDFSGLSAVLTGPNEKTETQQLHYWHNLIKQSLFGRRQKL